MRMASLFLVTYPDTSLSPPEVESWLASELEKAEFMSELPN